MRFANWMCGSLSAEASADVIWDWDQLICLDCDWDWPHDLPETVLCSVNIEQRKAGNPLVCQTAISDCFTVFTWWEISATFLTLPEIDGHITLPSFRNVLLVWVELSAYAICMSESIKCMLGTVSISFLFSLTIHLSTYFLSAVFPLFPLRSPSSTRPLIRAAELFNIRQWAWLLSQKEMKRRGGKAGETEKHGGVRYCGKSWVSRERKEQWEGRVKEFIDSFRWYDRREWRQMPPGAFVSVFVHARIDWAEKVMELRGD